MHVLCSHTAILLTRETNTRCERANVVNIHTASLSMVGELGVGFFAFAARQLSDPKHTNTQTKLLWSLAHSHIHTRPVHTSDATLACAYIGIVIPLCMDGFVSAFAPRCSTVSCCFRAHLRRSVPAHNGRRSLARSPYSQFATGLWSARVATHAHAPVCPRRSFASVGRSSSSTRVVCFFVFWGFCGVARSRVSRVSALPVIVAPSLRCRRYRRPCPRVVPVARLSVAHAVSTSTVAVVRLRAVCVG